MITDATPRQKIKIAQLCMALKITEPIEEKPMSKGQAGLMIRKLLVEVKYARNCVSALQGHRIDNKDW